MPELTQTTHSSSPADRAEAAEPNEWLETDGLGGFACGTSTDVPARRYHGLLVAPLPDTNVRHLFVGDLRERIVTASGESVALGPDTLVRFELCPWPRWRHRAGEVEVTRELVQVRGRHTTLVRYRVVSDEPVVLDLRPGLACREAGALTFQNDVLDPTATLIDSGIRCRPYASLPPVSITAASDSEWRFSARPQWRTGIEFATDLARGYDGHEDRFSPGSFEVDVQDRATITLACTIDDEVPEPEALWQEATSSRESAEDRVQRCAQHADDFLYRGPGGRLGVIAGFPWFGEWGRDTFIALPGLTLARGRLEQCAEVLSGAGEYLADGLLPNIFGASKADSHYGSVDASLWFARAVLLYDRAGGDRERLTREYLPALVEIATEYSEGTASRVAALHIAADDDMLIHAGAPELNPTWMDAKSTTGAVTPRHGYPVEICALWYSLLAHLVELHKRAGDKAGAKHWKAAAKTAGKAFVARFWSDDRGYLADTWRPNHEIDTSVRPNMVLAAAMELTPLKRNQRRATLERARRDLLTPFGLRTLAPSDPAYEGRYAGDAEARDRAYHQGTVWPWLLGFYCEAWLRVEPKRRTQLRGLWDRLLADLDHGGLDHVAEVYDGDPPHHRGGTFAQAWSTAELLRAIALIEGRTV